MPTIIDGTTGVDKVQDGAVTNDSITEVAATKLTGTVPTARLGSGTANSTTFLRGDGSWQVIETTPTTSQVLAATAGATAGAVGTYAWLWSTNTTTTNAGSTKAGSNLRYAGFRSTSSGTTNTVDFGSASQIVGNGGTPAGTWRAMGRDFSATGYRGMTLWLRIS